MQDVSPDKSTVRVTGLFGGMAPTDLFDYWVKPELLTQWWPRTATVDARVGGAYKFTWPPQDWVLEGQYTAIEPGKHLGFTWTWTHDHNDFKPLQVDLTFEPAEDGCQLTIDHGPWDESEDAQTERLGVIEGWIHFGMRLAGLHQGDAT